MGLIRPDLAARLRDRREAFAAIAALLAGLWIAARGGWFFALLGGLVALVAAGWLLAALRRVAFLRPLAAPGVVEIDEGEIRYFGAQHPGGRLALRDLSEIRLVRLDGRDHWRLRSVTGEAMLVPVEARNAAALADAFAALPGLDMGRLSRALSDPDRSGLRVVWTRP